jgi:hypothetical protein
LQSDADFCAKTVKNAPKQAKTAQKPIIFFIISRESCLVNEKKVNT